jgi:hypothetical protein
MLGPVLTALGHALDSMDVLTLFTHHKPKSRFWAVLGIIAFCIATALLTYSFL